MAMYLHSLEITIYDYETDEMIASGQFKNASFFHSFPNLRSKVREIVDGIFEAAGE